jgi:ABC-2 type transport system permease protein
MSWLRIRELVRKEFILLFRDPRNRRVLVVAPVIMLLLFGYVVNYDIRDIRVALMDQSHTRESRMIIDAVSANKIFRITHFPTDHQELETLLLKGKIDLGIKIGPDLSGKIRKGETAEIQIIADGSMSNMASIRIAYLVMVIDKLNRELIKELHPLHMDYGKIDGRIRTWYNPNLDSQHFFVPGIVAFVVMLITLLLTSIAVIKEKEAGTIEQLIVTPLKPVELIVGKTIPYIIISLTQMVVVTIIAVFWFQVPLSGSLVLLFFATCIFLLSTLGVGLFISTVSKTAAGHDDHLFFPPALLHAERFCISHRQYACRCAMVDISQSFEVYVGNNQRNFPERRWLRCPLASICRHGYSRTNRVYRRRQPFPKTA